MSRVFLPAAAAMLLALPGRPGQPAPVAKRATPAPSPSPSASPDVSPSPAADAQQAGPAPPPGGPARPPAGVLPARARGCPCVCAGSRTSRAPVSLGGPRAAVIDGGGVDAGYAVHLDGAS